MRHFIAFALWALAAAANAADTGNLVKESSGSTIPSNIDGLLVNNASGHVSAASLVGSEGLSMTVVENVRDFSLLFKGLDKGFQTFGVAITPARSQSPFPKINLRDYANGGLGMRMLGALTLGYAQGKTTETGKEWERRALSIESSAFLDANEDPVVAVAKASACGRAALSTPADDNDAPSLALARAAAAAQAAAGAGTPPTTAPSAPRQATPVSEEENKQSRAAFSACAAKVLKGLEAHWNRSRFSVSYASGWLRPVDRSFGQEGLGRTFALGLVYGFDGLGSDMLRDNAAVTVTLRRSQREPVLKTLGTATPVFRDTTLAAVRLAGGSAGFRGLLEFSNAGKEDITTSRRTFTRALGLDYSIAGLGLGDIWLGLRYGKQRRVTGSGDESGSFLNLSYSPKPSLGL
jgi:hypothetical protein